MMGLWGPRRCLPAIASIATTSPIAPVAPLRPRTRRRRVPVPLQQQASELVGARIQLGVERPTGIGDRKRFGRSSRDRFDPLVTRRSSTG